jgi:hypothetical protein
MNKSSTQENNHRYALGFSIAGSLIIILFLAFINFYTGSRFPWFIFPTYAILWWPVSVFFVGKHSMKMFSLVGSFITIALLFLTNYLTSWNYPWFLFPSFAILWWPIAMFFGSKSHKAFSIIASLVIIAFSIVTNLVISPSVIWFYYPLFAVIWWPLAVFFAKSRKMKAFSILGSLLLILFFTLDNNIRIHDCPWALFTYYPVLLWPVGVSYGKRMGNLGTTLLFSFTGIIYYLLLNLFVFPGFPWVIFPAYAILWWPLAIAFAKRGKLMLFSLFGFLLSSALFITVNAITTPKTIWAIYPIFVMAWWPLAIYFFVFQRNKINNQLNLGSGERALIQKMG